MKRKKSRAFPIEAFEFEDVDKKKKHQENVEAIFLITFKEEIIRLVGLTPLDRSATYWVAFYIGAACLAGGNLIKMLILILAIPVVRGLSGENAAIVLLTHWRPELKIRSAGWGRSSIVPRKYTLEKINFSRLYFRLAGIIFAFSVVLVMKQVPFREHLLTGLSLIAWYQHLSIKTAMAFERTWKASLIAAWKATKVTCRNEHNIQ